MTGNYETIIYENDGRRARITFNRPHILNAVAMTGAREFDRLAAEIADDTDIRIVTIAGTVGDFHPSLATSDIYAIVTHRDPLLCALLSSDPRCP